jgi:hypothetical protein
LRRRGADRHPGNLTVIANSFQGQRLNRPNDVVVRSDGSIYFTDPTGPAAPEQWDLSFAGVFRVSADLGTMTLLVGSPPCQEISAANTKGAGITDDQLFWEWALIVKIAVAPPPPCQPVPPRRTPDIRAASVLASRYGYRKPRHVDI